MARSPVSSEIYFLATLAAVPPKEFQHVVFQSEVFAGDTVEAPGLRQFAFFTERDFILTQIDLLHFDGQQTLGAGNGASDVLQFNYTPDVTQQPRAWLSVDNQQNTSNVYNQALFNEPVLFSFPAQRNVRVNFTFYFLGRFQQVFLRLNGYYTTPTAREALESNETLIEPASIQLNAGEPLPVHIPIPPS